MKISINEFEQHIDEDILKRGLQYFKKGYVTAVDEMSPGNYEATVEGSETYTIRMEIHNGMINSSYCDCPYDWGPFCKHEVAVMFYLQQDELQLEVKTTQKKKAAQANPLLKEKKKKMTVQDKLNEILNTLSHEELKGFVGECCDKDRKFREAFLLRYVHLIEPVTQAAYNKQIRSIVSSYSGRYGYLDWSAARQVGKEIVELSQLGHKAIDGENYREAMYIGCAILEEMTKAINHGDDSNGDLGNCIRESINLIVSVSDTCTDPKITGELFDYCTKAYLDNTFKGWDWHNDLLSIAVSLMQTGQQKEKIRQIVSNISPKKDSWDFEYDHLMLVKGEFIRKTEGEKGVREFMESHIQQTEFRQKLIDAAIKEQDYPRALELCEAGIVQDQKDKPGLATRWRTLMLQVYQQQNNPHKIIEMARFLFLDGGNSMFPKQLYDIIKTHVLPDEWNPFFEKLVVDKIKSDRWVRFHAIADMYIWEERWEDLMSLLMKNADLDHISSVEKYLAKDYAPQLVELYYQSIEKFLENSVGRSHYQTACRYIHRMIKLGGRDEVDILVKELRQKYPQRRALMEELNKL